MSMTIPQLSTEIKRLFDESYTILAKTDGQITEETSNEDRARLTENKGKILALEAERERLVEDQADTDYFSKGRDTYRQPVEHHRQPNGRERDPYARSVGAGVIESEPYQAARKSGLLSVARPQLQIPLPESVDLVAAAKRAGLAQKALLTSADASGGAFVVPDRLAGWTERPRGELAYLDLLPTQTTTSDLVEWIVQDTRTNAAAPVSEATASTGTSGTKPESTVAFSLSSKGVETIATYIPTTTRIINDAPMLRSAVDDELLYMLREELEEQCVIGTGASPQLQGINTAAGIQTLAAGASPIDAIFNASMAVRFTGGVPATAAVVNPTTWAALRLARENAASATYGGYLMGPPNMPGPLTIFGLEVAVAQAVPATVAFVLNMTATTIALIMRQGGTIETGWINDQFIRNMLTLRAELRAVQAIRRPLGIVKLTGMP